MVKIIETERLNLRQLEKSDAPFILNLLNQPSFIKNIGDRNVRDLVQAADFIETRYRKSYFENGYGLYLVELKSDESPVMNSIGICGFVKRAELPEADIGFAFLPDFEGRGYAFESAEAILSWGADQLELKKVLAITTLVNERSIRLLKKLGFILEKVIELNGAEKVNLFSKQID